MMHPKCSIAGGALLNGASLVVHSLMGHRRWCPPLWGIAGGALTRHRWWCTPLRGIAGGALPYGALLVVHSLTRHCWWRTPLWGIAGGALPYGASLVVHSLMAHHCWCTHSWGIVGGALTYMGHWTASSAVLNLGGLVWGCQRAFLTKSSIMMHC